MNEKVDVANYPLDHITTICNGCNVDLDNSLYDIKEHPIIGVPLCIICYINVTEKLQEYLYFVDDNNIDDSSQIVAIESNDTKSSIYSDSIGDICGWCLDGGSLNMCSNENCLFSFCDDCLLENLTEKNYNKIKFDENWECLVCNTIQLDTHHNALNALKNKSIYSDYGDREFENETDYQYGKDTLQIDCDILIALEEDRYEFCESLNLDQLEQKENDIRKELLDQYNGVDYNNKVIEELEVFKSWCLQHIDILQYQIAIISKRMDSHNYRSDDILNKNRNFTQEDNCLKDENSYVISAAKENSNRKIDKSPPTPTTMSLLSENNYYNEEDELLNNIENKEKLASYESLSLNDVIVCKYCHRLDLIPNSIPKYFYQLVPSNVLKALKYCTSRESLQLQLSYNIPDHIILVMKYLHEKNDNQTRRKWSFANEVHPSVLKALYYGTSREQSVLIDFYQLDQFDTEMKEIVDCGDASTLFDISSDYKKNKNLPEPRFSLDQLESLAQEEDYYNNEQQLLEEKKGEYRNNNNQLCDNKPFKIVNKSEDQDNKIELNIAKYESSSKNIRNKSFISKRSTFNKSSVDSFSAVVVERVSVHATNESKQSDEYAPTEIDIITNNERNDNSIISIDDNNSVQLVEDFFDSESWSCLACTYLNKQSVNICEICGYRRVSSSNIKAPESVSKVGSSAIDASGKKRQYDMKDYFRPNSSLKKVKKESDGINDNTDEVEEKENLTSEEWRRREHKEKMKKFDEISFNSFKVLNGQIVINEISKDEVSITLADGLGQQLKSHQVEGIKFLWGNVINSLKSLTSIKYKANGCLLAHCMGLGKTFTLIAFSITLLANPHMRKLEKSKHMTDIEKTICKVDNINNKLISRILIVNPKNTTQNWVKEFKRWTPNDLKKVVCVDYIDDEVIIEKIRKLKKWFIEGGVMIMSYEMFRILTTETVKNKNIIIEIKSYLLTPGPDIVIADEAHTIKEPRSSISICLHNIATRRRIALTGSPLQNNLTEYWTMINWVKEYHLGRIKEFRRRYSNPIKIGESVTSTADEVKLMKKKSYLLHKRLQSIVHRKDISELRDQLKPMRQFVIILKMTDFQRFMYKLYLKQYFDRVDRNFKSPLFEIYQALMRIWNHPICVVRNHTSNENDKLKKLAKQNRVKRNKTQLKSSSQDLIKMVREDITPLYQYFVKYGNQLTEDLKKNLEGKEEDLLKGNGTTTESFENNDCFDTKERIESVLDDSEDSLTLKTDDDIEDIFYFVKLIDICEFDTNKMILLDNEMRSLSNCCIKVSATKTELDFTEFNINDLNLTFRASADFFDLKLSLDPIADFYLITSLDEPYCEINSKILLIEELEKSPLIILKIENDKENEENAGLSEFDRIWWKKFDDEFVSDGSFTITNKDVVIMSNKILCFLSILALSVMQDDKVLLFSQSLYAIEAIEMCLAMDKWNELLDIEGSSNSKYKNYFSHWSDGNQYLKIDGSTNNRQPLIDKFNSNPKYKLFLISTKAGNMGINLQAANRIVIFDSSWNPVNDLQACYRVYRLGQKKNVFVYRLLAGGSMEEKIYKKQVAKQALAARVIDAQMPKNNFSVEENSDLYEFEDTVIPSEGGLSQSHSQSNNEKLEKLLLVLKSGTREDDIVLHTFVSKSFHMLLSLQDQGVLLEDLPENHLDEADKIAAELEENLENRLENRNNNIIASNNTNNTNSNDNVDSNDVDNNDKN